MSDQEGLRTPAQVVGWQWHVCDNCWTPCDPPSEEELRSQPDKFRPVYLRPPLVELSETQRRLAFMERKFGAIDWDAVVSSTKDNAQAPANRGALLDLLAGAYNEGFGEGMRESNSSKGGWPWSSRKQKYSALLDKALSLSSTDRASPRAEGDPLAEFFRWAMENGPFDGCELDGADVQEKAAALGLIETAKDREDWWVYTEAARPRTPPVSRPDDGGGDE